MPDGDVVHSKLAAPYWGPYKGLVSHDFNPKATAHDLAVPLKKGLAKQADLVVRMVTDGISQLNRLPHEPLLKQGIDYGQVSRTIDILVQGYPVDHRTMELVRASLKRQLDNFRHDNQEFNTQNAVQDCFMATYDSQFAGRVPLTAQHPNDIDFSTVEQRLQEMRPEVEKEIHKFAKDAIAKKRMRHRPLPKQKPSLYDSPY